MRRTSVSRIQSQQGIMALIVTLLVAAATLTYGLSLALMNADQILTSQAVLNRSKAFSWTGACVDNVLSRLRNDSSLNGNVNVNNATIICEAVVSSSATRTTINVSATSTDGFGRNTVSRVTVRVNTTTEPFTIEWYKDILE